MLSYGVVALMAALPVALLTSHSAPSAVFYGLILMCLILMVRNGFSGFREQTLRYRWLLVSYAVLFLSVVWSSIVYGKWAGANSEGAIRLFFGLWVLLLALPLIRTSSLKHGFWGVYAAGIISSFILVWLILKVNPRPLTPGIILTTYSSVMLLLGAISIYSLKWRLTKKYPVEQGLKIAVAIVTFSTFVLAQTRTGLLGLPLFILLGLILFVGLEKPKRFLGLLALCCVLLVGAVGSSEALRHRLVQGVEELKTCQDDSKTAFTSMCVRVQLWRSAIDAGSTHPWVGLGDGGRFHSYMQDVAVPKGLVSEQVVNAGFGEPHSDGLMFFAAFGVPGLLGILLIYFAPCFYFVPRLLQRDLSMQSRAAAAMGLATCLGFALFGLTELMFRRMNTMGFYVVLVALFMVLSDERQSETPDRT